MWPKMLLELLPHFARLMPVADKYLSSRTQSDQALQTSMSSLGTDVRGELRHVTEEQAGIRSQLQEQSAQIGQASVEATRARIAVESVEARVAKLEKSVTTITRLLVAVLALLVIVLTMLIVRKA